MSNSLRLVRRIKELCCTGNGTLQAMPVVVEITPGQFVSCQARMVELVDVGAVDGELFEEPSNETSDLQCKRVIVLERDVTL